MNRNYLNLILLAGVAVLGATVYFSREQPVRLEPLTALKADAVTHIALDITGEKAIRLEKTGEHWMLVEPVRAPADEFAVSTLTGIASTEVQNTLDPGSMELADLGLSPPTSVIHLNDQTIEFGTTEPLKHRRYVRIGERTALITDPPQNALDADYSDLVARGLLPPGTRPVRIEAPGLNLQKGDEDHWSSPEHPEAEAAALKAVPDAWMTARALWNALAPAVPADGEGQDHVRLTLDDGQTLDFRIVSREPQFVLERADLGIRYTVARESAQSLVSLPAPPAAPAPAADSEAPPTDGASPAGTQAEPASADAPAAAADAPPASGERVH
jgi:hypothetical protein